MESLNDKEYSLFVRFNKLEDTYKIAQTRNLLRDIRIYLKHNGAAKQDGVLFYASLILEMFSIEHKNENVEEIFDYTPKLKKTYHIGKKVIEKFKSLTVEDFDLYYLKIAKPALLYANTIEDAEELSKKSLKALKNLEKNEAFYNRSKFHHHLNMIERALKADFFEVDHVNDKERSKLVKDIYEYHLKEALQICEISDLIEEKDKVWLKIKAAIMERNSHELTKNVDYILEKERGVATFKDMIREEVSYYSFDPGFSLNKRHFHIALGIRIRKLREIKGLRQDELSHDLNYDDITGQTVAHFEKGETSITLFKILEVASYFEVPLEKLLYGISKLEKLNSEREYFENLLYDIA